LEIFETVLRSDLKPVKGEGCWLWDEEGKRYLDLLAGTWCNILGHGHPRFIQAIRIQAEKLIHTGSGVVTKEVRDAADRLGAILPAHLNKVTFLNTGSEAVEFAVKAARIATNRSEVIGFRQGYYGATLNALSLSEIGRGATYLPETSKIPPIPAPTCYHCPIGRTYPDCQYACLDEWRADAKKHANRVAAIIFEPVQGRGITVPPPGYLNTLAKVAEDWGCLLISEEVTTGIGRTGHWFGFQREEISPDIVVLGKALGNGLPVASVVTTTEVERAFAGRFTHVQSHQNDPFSAAVAATVIDIVRDERLVERARDMGEYFLRGLDRIRSAHAGISNTRGLGLMAALELDGPNADERGVRIKRKLRDQGIIVDFNGPVASLRFFPPYVVTKQQLDMALEALDSAVGDSL
jgi:4-aminobutyrate aminotransferase-like enzyme